MESLVIKYNTKEPQIIEAGSGLHIADRKGNMQCKIVRKRDVEAWKRALKLVIDTFGIRRNFPNEDKFGLVAQMRKTAVSTATKAFMDRDEDTGQTKIGSEQKGENYFLPGTYCLLSADGGIALVSALLISLAVSLLIISTVYFIIQSTRMSGAGKRYSTASEAADGAVEVAKDAINLIMMGEPVSSLPIVDADPPCLVDSIAFNEDAGCTISLTLPGAGLFDDYKAAVTVTRLYSTWFPGSRLEFAREGGGAPASAVYFRINSVVSGPDGTRAETTVLYRLVQ